MTHCGRNRLSGLLLAALVMSVAHDAGAQSVLYGLTDDGIVYSSSDAAGSWSAQATLGTSTAAGLVAAADGRRVLVTRDGTAWRRDGRADTWTAVGGFAASDVVDLTITRTGRLLAVTATGIVRASDDAGVTWTAIASLPASDVVSIAATSDDAVLVLTRTGIVWRADAGEPFAAVGAQPVSDAVAIRARFGRLLVLTSVGTVARSVDGGMTWQVTGTLSQVGSIALCATAAGWAAATSTGDVATSTDGTDWTWAGTLSQSGLVGLASAWSLVTSVESDPLGGAPLDLAAFPNPAPSGSTVFLRLIGGFTSRGQLEVFDTRGRRVARAVVDGRGVGAGRLAWTGARLSSGVYHLRLSTPAGRRATTRWVVVD